MAFPLLLFGDRPRQSTVGAATGTTSPRCSLGKGVLTLVLVIRPVLMVLSRADHQSAGALPAREGVHRSGEDDGGERRAHHQVAPAAASRRADHRLLDARLRFRTSCSRLGLSFLGVGIQLPTASWGNLLSSRRRSYYTASANGSCSGPGRACPFDNPFVQPARRRSPGRFRPSLEALDPQFAFDERESGANNTTGRAVVVRSGSFAILHPLSCRPPAPHPKSSSALSAATRWRRLRVQGEIRARGYWEQVWRRFRRDRVALASIVFLFLVVLICYPGATIAERIIGHSPDDPFPDGIDDGLIPVGPWHEVYNRSPGSRTCSSSAPTRWGATSSSGFSTAAASRSRSRCSRRSER